MGQHLSQVDSAVVEWIDRATATVTSESFISNSSDEYIFLPTYIPTEPISSLNQYGNHNRIHRSETLLIERIQTYLLSLTNANELHEFDAKMNKILMTNCFIVVVDHYQSLLKEMKMIKDRNERLRLSFKAQLNENNHSLIFAETGSGENAVNENQQFSYFAIQLLTSLLLVFINAQKTADQSASMQIMDLATQLCRQIPIKNLDSVESPSSSKYLMFKSLTPLTDYIRQLSLSNNQNLSTKATELLLKLSIAQALFRSLLPIISRLVFDCHNSYNVKYILQQMNNCLTDSLMHFEQNRQKCSLKTETCVQMISLEYLKSNGVFPNVKLTSVNEKKFTGEFIASILLAHIDVYNEINTNADFRNGTIQSSISFELQPNTFKQLFQLIRELTFGQWRQRTNSLLNHILLVCVRLTKNHLKCLSIVKSNADEKQLINRTNEPTETISESVDIDFPLFASNDELTEWFDLLLKLTYEETNDEPTILCRETSRALIYVLDLKSKSFIDKLSFIHKHILENQSRALVDTFCSELNRNETILNWIHSLCHMDCQQNEALSILYSLIDLCFDSSSQLTTGQKQELQEMLSSLQKILLLLIIPEEKLNLDGNNGTDHAFYLNHTTPDIQHAIVPVFVAFILKMTQAEFNAVKQNCLIDQILAGLCLITQTEVFQSVGLENTFIKILPILADASINCKSSERSIRYWTLGKIINLLIIGQPTTHLEIKYADKLKSPLFIGGCENSVIEQSEYLSSLRDANVNLSFSQTGDSPSDHQFLMSIFNNTGEGAKLISKMKRHSKTRHQLLKSIEKQATRASSVLFAVYIKHYRRINLARAELLASDDKRPQSKLLSLYEYANQIETLFTNAKAQGDDCNELFENILKRASFLLLDVKESNILNVIRIDCVTPPRHGSEHKKIRYKFIILKHMLDACVRFKRLMLARKQAIAQNQDNESILHKEIHNFISAKSEDTQLELNELRQCLIKQHERATIRLFTYRLVYSVVEKLVKLEDKQRVSKILRIVLGYTRGWNSNWFYLEHVQATNDQLKQEIRNAYYSIVKVVLSFLIESKLFERSLFSLLSLSYKPADIHHIHDHELIEPLVTHYVNLIEEGNHAVLIDRKLVAYTWFRLYALTLCKNVQIEERKEPTDEKLVLQQNLIFNQMILNELKELRRLKQSLPADTEVEAQGDGAKCKLHSLENCSVGWFVYAVERLSKSERCGLSNFEIEQCANQWLTLLLQCVHLYEPARLVCATMDFVEELMFIYENSKNDATKLLALKILRDLFPHLPESANGSSRSMMKKRLHEFLFSIGENCNPCITTELIYIYRTIMKRRSGWQVMSIEMVFNGIVSVDMNIESLESLDIKQWNILIGSLCVLGGYIEPCGLGSVVKVYTGEESNYFNLGIVLEVDVKHSLSDNEGQMPMFRIRDLRSNKVNCVSNDKLETEEAVSPPDLLALPLGKHTKYSMRALLDMFGAMLKIDVPPCGLLRALELKRYAMSALYRILNHNRLIDIFMQKPYASAIAQLAVKDPKKEVGLQPADLREFCKLHLEQYCLSLNQYNRLRPTTDVVKQEMHTTKQNKWKPCMSKVELETYKIGRYGKDEISIVPIPFNAAASNVFEECGRKHRFRGRIVLDDATSHVGFPSFIVEDLELTEGNWYFCVRLPTTCIAQIGWATRGFCPDSSEGNGIGDDQYSWSFDGSRGTLYSNQEFRLLSSSFRWKENDVCGCGIEINGENTRIKYWLNGEFLGTLFAHGEKISSSNVTCDLLPHGRHTVYYPGITLQGHSGQENCCEFIISPEDMAECPMPDGYKPLLMPRLIQGNIAYVAYPFSAYLVGDKSQDSLCRLRNVPSRTFLRDFINEKHIETTFTVNDMNQVELTENSSGFPFSIDDELSSLTISFDFQLLKTNDDISNHKSNFQLFTLKQASRSPIELSCQRSSGTTKAVIKICLNKQQIKVYINNDVQMVDCEFQLPTVFNFHFLPNVSAALKNFALWKYELSEEHVSRLMKNGLSYVVDDYDAVNEHRLQANTFTFKKDQQYFLNEYLVPMNRPFDEMNWKETQQQCQCDESKYFKNIHESNESILQLYDEHSYLVAKKSIDKWLNYTIIFDIRIPNYSVIRKQIALVELNLQALIFLSADGKIHLMTTEDEYEGESAINFSQFVRLTISVTSNSITIYANNSKEICEKVSNQILRANPNRLSFFREDNPDENAKNQQFPRLQCKSITFLNRAVNHDDYRNILQSPNYSLEFLVAPPFSLMSSSLINIGYKIHWIKSIMDEYKTTNLQFIDTKILENLGKFLKSDRPKENKELLDILSRLSPSINDEKLYGFISSPQMDTDNRITKITEHLLTHWNDFQTSINKSKPDQNTHDFNGNNIFAEWLQENSTLQTDRNSSFQLFDLTKLDHEQNSTSTSCQDVHIKKTAQYSKTNIPYNQYVESRMACENGLMIIYARHLILNMLNVWLKTNSRRFPLEQFGDYSFIIRLFRSIDSKNIVSNEDNDPIKTLTMYILKNEITQLNAKTNNNPDIQFDQMPFFYHLYKEMIVDLIHVFVKLSSLADSSNQNLRERIENEQRNLNFILKMICLFVEVLTDESTVGRDSIDRFVQMVFSEPLVNIMFDLFLLLPTCEAKILVIQCFVSLLKASTTFYLNDHIQQFMSRLLIESLTSETAITSRAMKSFQISIMELMYFDVTRTKAQSQAKFEMTLIDLPTQLQDLCMIIDVINVITGETKEANLPDSFFAHAFELLDSSLDLNLYDVHTASMAFNKKADLELVAQMNNELPMHDSFSQFITNLYRKSGSRSMDELDKYPTLSSISISDIATRAKLFYVLEILIGKFLWPFVDLNLPAGKHTFSDKFRQVKYYISNLKRQEWCQTLLDRTKVNTYSTTISIEIDLIRATDPGNNNGNHTVFYQCYEQLYEKAHRLFRGTSTRLWRAQFIGMHSNDQGGPYRDSITLMCSDICSNRLSLFILCPNGRTNAGLNCDRWIPNTFPPGQAIPLKIRKQYRFVGQLMGMAIRKKHYLDLKFPELLWKQLLGEPITIKDIEAIDLQSCALIREMENEIEGRSATENSTDTNYLFTSVMSELRFEIVSSAGHTYELIPGGADIPITAENIKEYCSRYREYRLNEFRRQIEYIGQGLCSVVPSDFLSLLTVRELEELVCGKGEIDVELLKRNTEYRGCHTNNETIQRFWKVFGEMFNNEQKKLFVKFVCGAVTLPRCDKDFNGKFCITLRQYDPSLIDSFLPEAQTCSFSLCLPMYSSVEIMYKRLNYAINYCPVVDADG